MYRLALLFSSSKTIVYLCFISVAIIIPGRVFAAQIDAHDDPDKIEISTETERITAFTDGEVEKINGDMLVLNDAEYIFTEKTEFTNIAGDSLAREDIQKGDIVRIIFDPINNNTLLKAILQEDTVEKPTRLSTPSPANDNRKPDVITLKNGIYSN